MVAQLEVVSSKVSHRKRLKKFHLWQAKTTVEYVVGQDEFSEVGDAQEKRYSVDEACPRVATLACL